MLSLVFVASLRITFDLNNSSSPTKTRSQTLRWLYHSPIRVCFAVCEARLSVAKFFLSFCLSDSDSDSDSWLIVNFCALLMAIGDKSNWKPKLLFCKQRLLISRLGVPRHGGGVECEKEVVSPFQGAVLLKSYQQVFKSDMRVVCAQ